MAVKQRNPIHLEIARELVKSLEGGKPFSYESLAKATGVRTNIVSTLVQRHFIGLIESNPEKGLQLMEGVCLEDVREVTKILQGEAGGIRNLRARDSKFTLDPSREGRGHRC